MPIMENELVHGCGRTFRYPAHYAKHGLGCDGTKAATSGRIAARDGERTPPARKRSSVLREKKATRKKRDVALAVLVPSAKPVSTQDFLASLDMQIEKLQRVREAVAEIA